MLAVHSCRVAAQSQALAIGRLSASQATIKAGAAAVAQAASSHHSRQLESLVQFKAKVDEVRDSMSKNAEKTRWGQLYVLQMCLQNGCMVQ